MAAKDAVITYTVSDQIAHREIEGQILILLPNDSYLYTMNDSGKFLWQAILDGQPSSRLVTELAAFYGIPEGQAAKDVKAFLVQLKRKGIIG